MERKVIQEHINMYDKWGERCMINGEYLYKMKDETFLNFINMYENLDQTSNIYNDDINYTQKCGININIFFDLQNAIHLENSSFIANI